MSGVWIVNGGLTINITNADSYALHVRRVKFEADGTPTALDQAARFKVDGDLLLQSGLETRVGTDL